MSFRTSGAESARASGSALTARLNPRIFTSLITTKCRVLLGAIYFHTEPFHSAPPQTGSSFGCESRRRSAVLQLLSGLLHREGTRLDRDPSLQGGLEERQILPCERRAASWRPVSAVSVSMVKATWRPMSKRDKEGESWSGKDAGSDLPSFSIYKLSKDGDWTFSACGSV